MFFYSCHWNLHNWPCLQDLSIRVSISHFYWVGRKVGFGAEKERLKRILLVFIFPRTHYKQASTVSTIVLCSKQLTRWYSIGASALDWSVMMSNFSTYCKRDCDKSKEARILLRIRIWNVLSSDGAASMILAVTKPQTSLAEASSQLLNLMHYI